MTIFFFSVILYYSLTDKTILSTSNIFMYTFGIIYNDTNYNNKILDKPILILRSWQNSLYLFVQNV